MCTHATYHVYTRKLSCVHMLGIMFTLWHIFDTWCREWKPKHLQSETDTDDTAEEDNVGGLGKFARGSFALSHQHWVPQLKSAGSFNVHDTEAAEGAHKLCMKQSSQRVRHLRQNRTQHSMLRYLCRYRLFEALMGNLADRNPRAYIRRGGMHLRVPLLCRSCITNERQSVTMGCNLASIASQRQFVHPEVRVARVELMDLLCDQLSLPKTRASYQKMNGLEWSFGQHLVMQTGTAYWATDSRYTDWTSENTRRRRDILMLRGTEQTYVPGPNANLVMTRTAYCCEAVCFITVSNIERVGSDLPPNVQQDVINGTCMNI